MRIAKDKQGHFIVGFLIAFAFSFINPIAGILAALFSGWLKEQLDKRDPEHHTYDLKDMYWTWAGGLIGIIFYYILKVILNG